MKICNMKTTVKFLFILLESLYSLIFCCGGCLDFAFAVGTFYVSLLLDLFSFFSLK